MLRNTIIVLMFAFMIPLVMIELIAKTTYEKATLAGGCFWCMTPPFEKLSGVKKVISGYTGGKGANPTYNDYSEKGYIEAVQITYDPSIISYTRILDVFWRQINPTDSEGQFCDRGPEYRPAIFYENKDQQIIAGQSKAALGKSGKFNKPITTEIIQASAFYPAEEYHQDYYKKNPVRYKYYRYRCGRDQFLDKVWGGATDGKGASIDADKHKKYTKEELKKKLTPIQYKVTQEEGTEPAYHNEYWDNKKEGIYVDVVSGEPLFSSMDKYDSGTGWPSFTKPVNPENIMEKEDKKLFTTRTEVRSKIADSHLGHVFPDGPKPTGLRYCMNSAALRFVPKENLVKEGYGQYLKLFK